MDFRSSSNKPGILRFWVHFEPGKPPIPLMGGFLEGFLKPRFWWRLGAQVRLVSSWRPRARCPVSFVCRHTDGLSAMGSVLKSCCEQCGCVSEIGFCVIETAQKTLPQNSWGNQSCSPPNVAYKSDDSLRKEKLIHPAPQKLQNRTFEPSVLCKGYASVEVSQRTPNSVHFRATTTYEACMLYLFHSDVM